MNERGAVQSTITHDTDTGSGSNPIYNTYFAYNEQGQLTSATISDYLYRSVSFTNDELGQIIRRDETRPYTAPTAQSGSPHEVWYRYSGRQLGYTGNNGGSDITTSASIAERQQVAPTAGNIGTFRNSSTYGAAYADFAQSYDPLNSYNQGAGGGSYTVRQGDTLVSIAQSIYGDGNLWYKIAEANGLSAGASLIEGRSLTLPTGVAKSGYNDTTFRPYNPQEAIGDLSPTNAKPPKKNTGWRSVWMGRQELSDGVWERISSHLPGKAADPGRTGRDNRLFVEAILWLARSAEGVWPLAHGLPSVQPLVS